MQLNHHQIYVVAAPFVLYLNTNNHTLQYRYSSDIADYLLDLPLTNTPILLQSNSIQFSAIDLHNYFSKIVIQSTNDSQLTEELIFQKRERSSFLNLQLSDQYNSSNIELYTEEYTSTFRKLTYQISNGLATVICNVPKLNSMDIYFYTNHSTWLQWIRNTSIFNIEVTSSCIVNMHQYEQQIIHYSAATSCSQLLFYLPSSLQFSFQSIVSNHFYSIPTHLYFFHSTSLPPTFITKNDTVNSIIYSTTTTTNTLLPNQFVLLLTCALFALLFFSLTLFIRVIMATTLF